MAADDIDAFLKGLAARWQPASRKVICTSLRSYFRFRTLLGDDTRTLSASLPTIANWPRRHPPKVLTDSQIEHFLHAFDLTDPVGLRDHAIALIAKSAEGAAAKLKLCRLAYGSMGSAGDEVSITEARDALEGS